MPQARNRARKGKQAAAAADGQPEFLQFLEKLTEDTFCQTLLPMLIEDGSAGSFAATCSQLRRLCHNGVEYLDLRSLLGEAHDQPSGAELWTQRLQERFPHCVSVTLHVEEDETYQAMSYVLPALARLPALTTLYVYVEGTPNARMLPMAMLLMSVRMQVTSLRNLTLALSQSWAEARLAWKELAAMTQLTRLCITSTYEEDSLCHKTDLQQLSKLCNLEDLYLCPECIDQAEHPVDLHLVSQMRALTALRLSVGSADGFSNLTNCRSLQNLDLSSQAGASIGLSAADWGVIGQLTQLTQLGLWPVAQRTDCDVCCAALKQLTGLKEVGAEVWAPEVLEGLRSLSQLTSVAGGWAASHGPPIDITCPQVVDLMGTQDHIPCSAFPNLLSIHLFRHIPSAVLTALSKHCCSLQCLGLSSLPETPRSPDHTLDAAEPVADRVAAVKSLSSLRHLTALDVSVTDDAEVLAVAYVAAVLRKHALTELRLLVSEDSQVSDPGMLGLAPASGIQVLHVWLLQPVLFLLPDAARVFVSVLADVGELHVTVGIQAQHSNLSSAFDHASACGLPLPQVHCVTIAD